MKRIAVAALALPFLLLALASGSWASGGGGGMEVDLLSEPVAKVALWTFIIAYLFVMAEEFTHLRKSKMVLLAAGAIWAMIAMVMSYTYHDTHAAEEALRHNMLEFGELFLFLLVAMTYVNTLDERRVFQALRSWLVKKGLSYRQLFWSTGFLAFWISPVADNLTTALLMCAVVMAVGKDNPKFVGISCINIVIAANAGGAFSPFGDITTLMVWQKGIVPFSTFFWLLIPSLVNWVVPAAAMSLAISKERPPALDEDIEMKRGAKRSILLFLLTIVTAVSFHNFLHLPPAAGMMLGLSYIQLFGFYLKKTYEGYRVKKGIPYDPKAPADYVGDVRFDIFREVGRAEWDTLMFFYGVILCVGGLGFIGYLGVVSQVMYVDWGATPANMMVGVLSAVVDNIPVMFAVLTMGPDMDMGQWLLVTLTAGVGGSMLSVGSAAGVALMGQARGLYTFFGHLKWTPVIAAGYLASIGVHFLVNSWAFDDKPVYPRGMEQAAQVEQPMEEGGH